MKTTNDYWFTIEPYVFINICDKKALLYNTLDGGILECEGIQVIKLLEKVLQKENCGVVLLTNETYNKKEINDFIRELRQKYMGDIIDIKLSKSKPIQLLPYYNLNHAIDLYKKHNFSPYKNIIENLSEISIYIDQTVNIDHVISFIKSIPENLLLNIVGDIKSATNYENMLLFLNKQSTQKNIICSYTKMTLLPPTIKNNFSYKISINFPIDKQLLDKYTELLFSQNLPFEYIFNITSLSDHEQTEEIIKQYKINKYHLVPIYNGDNISFFEKYVYHTKEDILSTHMSIKDFFANQSINTYDFGKINIMPNGDVYANVNHPPLGNIYTHNIYEIIQKEIDEGMSWFRIRNQAPCNTCIYQWLCPPPSHYEIEIGRYNLCHVKE